MIILEQLGFESRVITLEGAKDPAELLQSEGPKMLTKACSNSKSAFDHLVHSAINLYDGKKATGKLHIFTAVKPYLDAVESEIVKQSYLRDLASYLQVDEATLVRDYANRADTVTTRNRADEEQSRRKSLAAHRGWKRSTDLYAMLTLMNNRFLFPRYRNRLHIDDLVDEMAIQLYTVLEDAQREEIGNSDELILQMIDDDHLRNMVAESLQTAEFTAQPEQVLEESVWRITLRSLEKTRKHVENLIRLAEKDGSVATELSHLLLEKKSFDEKIAEMRKPVHA